MTLDRTKMAAVLGLLGSDFDGEVVAAARQAERLRKEAGATWHDIVMSPTLMPARPPQEGLADKLDELVDGIGSLNSWGQRFIASIAGRPVGSLTVKQIAVVERLHRELRARKAA